MNPKIVKCVSFILFKNDEVLLEKRSLDKLTDPGLVTIPGGHVEFGETDVDTLRRELKEELGIQPTNFEFLCRLHNASQELQLISYYLVTDWTGEIVSTEAEAVFWVDIKKQNTVEILSDQHALRKVRELKVNAANKWL